MSTAKKFNTTLRNQSSVIKALNYIWLNPGNDLSLEALSSICGVSKYHFHRIFKEYQSETLSEYIARRRLELAANQLIMFPRTNISKLVTKIGFSSAANFAKAFKRYFGITAKEWRYPTTLHSCAPSTLYSRYNTTLNLSAHTSQRHLDENEKHKRLHTISEIISFTYLEKKKVIYRTIRDGLNDELMLQLWNQVTAWADRNIENWHLNTYGTWYDNRDICPNHLARYDAAIMVPENLITDDSFLHTTFSSGVYATGVLSGTSKELVKTIKDIYRLWLPHHKIVTDLYPYREHYLNDCYEDGFLKLRFFIKIHPDYIKNIKLIANKNINTTP